MREVTATADIAGFERTDINTEVGRLATWHRGLDGASSIRVYIEGDGRAWKTRTRPSDNPTPKNPVGFRLALLDPGDAVVYLARPCQFLRASETTACDQRYWTSHRYSNGVVEALNAALNKLLERDTGGPTAAITLVGFSGGGALAALLSARRHDVLRLVTVAGNLDTEAWAAHHSVTPLTGSLNPIDIAEETAALPQLHFVGAEDKVIPAALAHAFVARSGSTNAIVRIIPDIDHGCCWHQVWPRLTTDLLVRR